MSSADLNGPWCARIVAWLRAAGLREAVVCPGNRNLPLLAALEACDEIALHSHVDERAAAFIALGLAQASGRPVAVCCTSGSAVANCLPALVEAHAARTPLVLLSGDRPARLQGCEAPQCMQQSGIFTTFLAAEIALGDPHDEPHRLDACLRDGLAFLPEGPVQINVPLDDPLVPARETPIPELPGLEMPREQCCELPSAITTMLRPGLRGVIVAGPRCPLSGMQVDTLARRTGFPVLADACSGLRRPAVEHLITGAPLLCAGAFRKERAELLIRLGPAPVARPVWEWCMAQRCPVVRIDRQPVPADFCHHDFALLRDPDEACLAQLAGSCGTAPAGWTKRWRDLDAQTARRIAACCDEGWHELAAVRLLFERQRTGLVQLANSLAVRHADLVCAAGADMQNVLANRGLNGIDGTLASFFGRCLHHASPRSLICGDLAAFHDATSLQWAASQGIEARILLLDNGGGRIFDLLPMADRPELLQRMRATTAVDWRALCKAFGAIHRDCGSRDGLATALAAAPGGIELLHCHSFEQAIDQILTDLRG